MQWDGTNDRGEMVSTGMYFLHTKHQKIPRNEKDVILEVTIL